MSYFGIEAVDEIYERYCNREYLRSLEVSERKMFMTLLNCFTVSVDPEKLEFISIREKELSVRRLASPDTYSRETGLALIEENDFDHRSA